MALALWASGLSALPTWQPWGVLVGDRGWWKPGTGVREARLKSRHCSFWCVALEPLVNLSDLPLSILYMWDRICGTQWRPTKWEVQTLYSELAIARECFGKIVWLWQRFKGRQKIGKRGRFQVCHHYWKLLAWGRCRHHVDHGLLATAASLMLVKVWTLGSYSRPIESETSVILTHSKVPEPQLQCSEWLLVSQTSPHLGMSIPKSVFLKCCWWNLWEEAWRLEKGGRQEARCLLKIRLLFSAIDLSLEWGTWESDLPRIRQVAEAASWLPVVSRALGVPAQADRAASLCVQIAHQVGISESGTIQGAYFGLYHHWGLLRGCYDFSVSYHLVFRWRRL